MKAGKKIVLIILLICVICNYMPIYTLARIISSGTNSLHFIVNHVHSAKLTKDEESGESKEIENGQDFVTIEGYIQKESGAYKLYIVSGRY